MNRPALQLAYITGRSLPGLTELSPQQYRFIHQLARPGWQIVDVNFPYISRSAPGAPRVHPGLLTASVNNSCDYLTSRLSAFRHHHHNAVVALLSRARQTVFLAGSCGLELFNNLHLPAEMMKTTSLIAYGAVARQRPLCRHILIQGRYDWLSKVWFRRADYRVSCGHMTYLTRPEVLAICEQFITEITSGERIL